VKVHWFHILAALADRDLHGLGIVRAVLEQTDEALRLWPATLYSALEDLAGAGLIRELKEEELAPEISAQRRYYALTDEGRRALEDEARRMAALASVVLGRLGQA